MSNYQMPLKAVRKFGRTPDIDSADTNEEVWDGTGAYSFLAAATTLTVSSSSADDAAAGTGAQTVKVFGLDASWQEVSETITLNGQTGVEIGTDLIRVYRAYCVDVGSGGINAGDIWVGSGTITAGVPANQYAGVLAGGGQTLMAIYSVPALDSLGNTISTGRISKWYAGIGAVQSAFATVSLQTREFGKSWRIRRVLEIAEGAAPLEKLDWGIEVGAKADIRIRVLTCGTNNSAISAGFDVMLHE